MRDLSVCLLSVLINKIRDLRKEISTVKRVAIKSVNLYKLLRKKKKKIKTKMFWVRYMFREERRMLQGAGDNLLEEL